MSDQTAANQPAETVLCKMGCGFFGNGATGGCCSKCWRANAQKKEESQQLVKQSATVEETTSMEVDEQPPVMEAEGAPDTTMEVIPETETPKKRKKKKASYKNLMAGVLKPTSPSRDIEKEKESLRSVTGGGAFSKIDKI